MANTSNAASQLPDWLVVLWQTLWNGVTPYASGQGSKWLNFLSPFIVSVNPTGGPDGAGSLDITIGGFGSVVTAAGNTQLPNTASILVEGDANGGAMTVSAPVTSADGYQIFWVDTSGATSGTNTVSFHDANGFQFQDPDQPGTFYSTYVLTTRRNLSWTRVTCLRTSTTFWAAN